MADDLVWPHPDMPRKAQFMLHAGREKELWALLRNGGTLVRSSLTSVMAKMREVLVEAEFVNRAMSIDLPRVGEVGLDDPGLSLGF